MAWIDWVPLVVPLGASIVFFLSGVVVNNSLLLINRNQAQGMAILAAVNEAGRRPIIFTSLTTFFGHFPMILETRHPGPVPDPDGDQPQLRGTLLHLRHPASGPHPLRPLRPRRRPPAVILPGRDGGTIKNSILITVEVQRGKASNPREVLHALDGQGGGLPPAGAEILPQWRLLDENIPAFLAEYDDRFLREYGFLRPVIADVNVYFQ